MYTLIGVLPAFYERRRSVVAASAAAIALGVALEYVQWFTGWRNFEYGDMLASAAGVLIGVTLGLLVRAGLLRKHESQDRFARDRLVADARRLKLP
jgi:VanZ family protein